MIIYSQNLTNYGITISDDAIYRINLAWVNSIDELTILLQKHNKHKIFMDLPVGRTKPPNNAYSLNDLIPIIKQYSNIKYFAISNVTSPNDLEEYLRIMPSDITIVPKIESPEGVKNIQKITKIIRNKEKIIMLDHDDLYSSLIKKGEPPSQFKEHVKELIQFCDENKITLLRTIGVIFSDEEKRDTQYVR
jgi:citrate lyase beta subunit